MNDVGVAQFDEMIARGWQSWSDSWSTYTYMAYHSRFDICNM